MAYRHFNGAPYLQCWSTGTHVCVRELDGRVNQYSCNLGVTIEPQIIHFHGPDAIWCLRKDGILYVGRNDSTFSGFRESEGLLVRYGAWEYPWYRHFIAIGQCDGFLALLDTDDHRTVYVHDIKKGYILHKALEEYQMIPVVLADMVKQVSELTIYTKEGLLNAKAVGAWVDAPILPGGDSTVQL